MPNETYTHLRIEGLPPRLTRLLTAAAASTDTHYPDTDDDYHNGAWRVMHNLYPVPADVLARRWEDAGRAWQEEHWGLYRYVLMGSMTRRSGRDAVFEISTPYRPPQAWVAKVAKDFPQLTFEHIYADDGHNFLGRCVYRRGRRVEGWEASDPSDRNPHALDVFLQTQWHENALPLLKRLLRRRPSEARLYLMRAQAHRKMEAGESDEESNEVDEVGVEELRKQVLPDLEKAIALDPHFAEAHLERASYLREQGRLDEARGALDAAVRANPAYATAWRLRAELRRNSEPKEAQRDINRALRLDPDDSNAYLLRGLVRQDMDRLEDALSDMGRAIALNPCSGPAYWERASTFVGNCLNQITQARTFRKYATQRDAARELWARASDKALDVLMRRSAAQWAKAVKKVKQYSSLAIADLDQAAIWGGPSRYSPEYVLDRGLCLNILGRHDDVITHCSYYCRRKYPGAAEGFAYLMRAKAYVALGKRLEAESDRKAAKRLLTKSDLADQADFFWDMAETPAAAKP